MQAQPLAFPPGLHLLPPAVPPRLERSLSQRAGPASLERALWLTLGGIRRPGRFAFPPSCQGRQSTCRKGSSLESFHLRFIRKVKAKLPTLRDDEKDGKEITEEHKPQSRMCQVSHPAKGKGCSWIREGRRWEWGELGGTKRGRVADIPRPPWLWLEMETAVVPPPPQQASRLRPDLSGRHSAGRQRELLSPSSPILLLPWPSGLRAWHPPQGFPSGGRSRVQAR